MGFGQDDYAKRYDLVALGLLDGPPLKAASIVTETAWENLNAASAAFIVFDDTAGEAVLHAVARKLKVGTRYPLHDAAATRVREDTGQARAMDLTRCSASPVEFTRFGMASMLAAPVAGPDTYAIGALAAFDTKPRVWSAIKQRQIEDLAYLITQEVMLHASFATLELMASERGRLNG